MSEGPPFVAKFGGVCGVCGFTYEKKETVHYVNGKVSHDTCHADDIPEDDWDTKPEVTQSFTIKGKRQPKRCNKCYIEHAGDDCDW